MISGDIFKHTQLYSIKTFTRTAQERRRSSGWEPPVVDRACWWLSFGSPPTPFVFVRGNSYPNWDFLWFFSIRQSGSKVERWNWLWLFLPISVPIHISLSSDHGYNLRNCYSYMKDFYGGNWMLECHVIRVLFAKEALSKFSKVPTCAIRR